MLLEWLGDVLVALSEIEPPHRKRKPKQRPSYCLTDAQRAELMQRRTRCKHIAYERIGSLGFFCFDCGKPME